MLEELVNRDVEVIVAFSVGYLSGGSAPEIYKGTLIGIDNDYCKLRLTNSKSLNKDIIISKKFIISIRKI